MHRLLCKQQDNEAHARTHTRTQVRTPPALKSISLASLELQRGASRLRQTQREQGGHAQIADTKGNVTSGNDGREGGGEGEGGIGPYRDASCVPTGRILTLFSLVN
jgi:hypothetical protein